MTINVPSSGGAGQPRVWLKTVNKGEETAQEYVSFDPAETKNTFNEKPRNTNRGIRSDFAILNRKIKRSLKRQIARRNHRKSSRGETPLEPPSGKDAETTNNIKNSNDDSINQTIAFRKLTKIKYGTPIKIATLNLRGIKRLGKREK